VSSLPPRSSLRWSLVAAAAVHAGLAAWAARAPRSSAAPPSAPDTQDLREVAIDVEAPPAEPLSPIAEVNPTRSSDETSPIQRAAGMHAATVDHTGATAGTEASPGPVASSEPGAADGTWTFDPTSPSGGASGSSGLSGAMASAMRSGVGAVVQEDVKKRQAFARSHGVLPVFTARDLELGLVPGGELVTLTRDLVRRSLAPDSGRALLQFDTDGAGIISSVRVLDVSSERAEWVRVAADILASSHGTTLRVPAGASGIAVTLEVTSAMKTVDGVTAGERSTFSKALRAINDPVGTVMDATTRPRRVVATRIVDVQAF
jgi:hypothetical protein